MEERNVYQDISRRTDGDVYIGVVRVPSERENQHL